MRRSDLTNTRGGLGRRLQDFSEVSVRSLSYEPSEATVCIAGGRIDEHPAQGVASSS